jgi:hypothetical protein
MQQPAPVKKQWQKEWKKKPQGEQKVFKPKNRDEPKEQPTRQVYRIATKDAAPLPELE